MKGDKFEKGERVKIDTHNKDKEIIGTVFDFAYNKFGKVYKVRFKENSIGEFFASELIKIEQ